MSNGTCRVCGNCAWGAYCSRECMNQDPRMPSIKPVESAEAPILKQITSPDVIDALTAAVYSQHVLAQAAEAAEPKPVKGKVIEPEPPEQQPRLPEPEPEAQYMEYVDTRPWWKRKLAGIFNFRDDTPWDPPPSWAKDVLTTNVRIEMGFLNRVRVLFGAPIKVETRTFMEVPPKRVISDSRTHIYPHDSLL